MGLAAALLLGSPAALPAAAIAAGGEIHLAWEDCRGGPAALTDVVFTCLTNFEQVSLVAGFTPDAPIDSLIAVEVVVDLQIEDATLPAWWRFEKGGCREGSLAAVADMSGTSCAQTWGPSGVALVQDYAVGQPRGGANQARIRAVVAVPSDSARTLTAGVVYGAVRLTLDSDRTVGVGECSGCVRPACIVLNSMLLRRLPGGTGDVYLEIPAPGNANQVTWASGDPGGCAAVPVRAATWGQVKSLYR